MLAVNAAAVVAAQPHRRQVKDRLLSVSNRIIFTPSGLETDAPDGTTVLDAARELGVDLDSVCGGRGICGRCQVVPTKGAFPKWGMTVDADALSAPGPTELGYDGKRSLQEESRLGCQAFVKGDVVVDIPESSQIHAQVVRKEVNLDGLTLDPVTQLRYLEVSGVAPPGLLLRIALERDWGIENATVPRELAPAIQAAITQARTDQHDDPDCGLPVGLTVALRTVRGTPTAPARPNQLVVAAVWPGFVDAAYGLAIDIGSTTIAGHLCNLDTAEIVGSSGQMNPQIRFGEDLMSRVSYVMMNPGGDEELMNAVRSALDELIGDVVAQADIDRDKILEMTMVGNPVMHHLLLGYDTIPLGTSPFTLETDEAVNIAASELDLDAPNAAVYIAPCIAGHVGADTAAAIVAERPHHSEVIQLLVDVGTNAEIVLGNREHLFACSSPTGPAFEGAQLSCGVRAAAGAIERVAIDPATLLPRFKVIGSDLWSDHPDFAPPAGTGVIGVCGSGVIEVLADMATAQILDRSGVIRDPANIGANAQASGRIVADGRTFSYVLLPASEGQPELRVTQNDVRAIQLAKAALKAGIDLLMDHAGFDVVDDIRLAGAFGAHIDVAAATAIDLIPATTGVVGSPGNSAGTGAIRLLLSKAERDEIEVVVRQVTKIETALEPSFQDRFVEAMAFPTAPEPTEPDGAQTRRRRRRRS